jgi:AcrR family transcriptional regulator
VLTSLPSTSPASTDLEPRRPGRPRDARADEAILQATLELTASLGVPGLSMDAVATRAGVSKATIYRRWASKEALVLEAWSVLVQPLDVPDTGSLLGDLRAFLHELADRMAEGDKGAVLPHLLVAARCNPDLAGALRDYLRTRREPLRQVLARAQRRGEVPARLDLEMLQDCIVGPLLYRVLVTREPVDRAFSDDVIGIVLAGLAGQTE